MSGDAPSGLARPVALSDIGTGAVPRTVVADVDERAAIASQFGLSALHSLEGEFALERDGDAIRVTGHVRASLEQACVVTGDPVPETIDATVALRLLPAGSLHAVEEEVELAGDALDVDEHDGRAIDLGRITAETLDLERTPYPRSAASESALRKAGVIVEGEEPPSGPFAALAALKREG